MKANREVVKVLIELAPNVDEADGTSKEDSDKMTYFAMLRVIINN